jgi:pimeloyl-ACP methyl ester carboxylesterase
MLDITPRRRDRTGRGDLPPAQAARITAVLVHGGWSDASSWMRVTPLLQAEGLEVLVVRNPLTRLGAAVEATRRAIRRAQGPVVLVAHGFGGSVITEAGETPGVEALVYLAAPAPDAGECDGELVAAFPRAPAFATTVLDDDGDAYQTPEGVRSHLAPDAPIASARVLMAAHGPLSARQLTDRVTVAAWRRLPSWAVVCGQDGVVVPQLAEACAARMGARVTRLDSGHACALSHPGVVAQVIADAADWVARAGIPQTIAAGGLS